MNSKKEEESVRLDLGNTEEEEEEEEESEFEESEIQEEDGEDEGIVDLDVNFDEDKPIEEPTEEKNLENKSELNIADASQIKENPENELDLENEENQLHSEIYNNQQTETAKKSVAKKKKTPGLSSASQKKNKMNSDLSHISPNKKRSENTEKTVFTRISEDLFNKFISNKDFYNKKTSSYDYLINDMFLNRVVEKNDRESAAKFNDFVNRNREFRDKKQMKLQERSEKIASEMNATYTGRPNGKVFDKTEIRDPQEYLQDQLKYYQTRDQNIKQQQEDIIKNTDSNIKKVPDISKKSKQLAEKRFSNDNSKEVHDRLFNDKLQKEKKHLYTEKSASSHQVSKITTLPQKKTREEIKDLVEKLYKDAETRRENKEKTQNDKLKFKEVYHVYDSDDELSCTKTNLKILEKFVENFKEVSMELFNKAGSFPITFQEFTNILVTMGFVQYNHDHPNHGEDLNKTETEKKIKEKELKLVKDAWKILLTGSSKNQNENEIPEENNEKVDTYQVMVFLASILGLYKGEENPEPTNMNNSHIMNTFAPTEGNQNEKVDTIPFSDVVEGTLPNDTPQGKNLSTFGHSTVSPKKEDKKKTKLSNRFSTPNDNTNRNTFSNMVNGSFSVTSQRKSKVLTDNKNKKPYKNLLKVVLPDLDTKKYQYFRSTVKQIKSLFRVMYDNRIHFIVEAKKKKMVDKLNMIKMVSEDSLMKQTSFASESLRQSADNFRKRIYLEVESEILSKPESHHGGSQHEGKIGRTLRLDEVYDILRKKKEK
jgi:hypothetical protein